MRTQPYITGANVNSTVGLGNELNGSLLQVHVSNVFLTFIYGLIFDTGMSYFFSHAVQTFVTLSAGPFPQLQKTRNIFFRGGGSHFFPIFLLKFFYSVEQIQISVVSKK